MFGNITCFIYHIMNRVKIREIYAYSQIAVTNSIRIRETLKVRIETGSFI